MDDLRRELDLLIRLVGHWGPPRWSADSRAQLVYELAQRLAERAADAEGQPRRAVPRLDSDPGLVDQLRVLAADLLAAAPAPDTLAAAAADVASVRHALSRPAGKSV